MSMTSREQRVRVQLVSRVGLEQGSSESVECVLENLSHEGAKLSVPDGTVVPGQFQLMLDQGGQSHCVELVWQEGTKIGVRFLEPLSGASRPVVGRYPAVTFKNGLPVRQQNGSGQLGRYRSGCSLGSISSGCYGWLAQNRGEVRDLDDAPKCGQKCSSTRSGGAKNRSAVSKEWRGQSSAYPIQLMP